MNMTVAMAIAGGCLTALLATWSQAKKFNTYRINKKITKLEGEVHEIEGKISEQCEAVSADRDPVEFHRLHSAREAANRRIYQLRKSIS